MNTTLRRRLYGILEMKGEKSRVSTIVNAFIMILIVVNVIAIILESVRDYQLAFGPWFWYLELVSVVLFTIEYVFRLVSVRRPMRYAVSTFGIIDLLAIVPTYLSLFFVGSQYLLVIRALRLLRGDQARKGVIGPAGDRATVSARFFDDGDGVPDGADLCPATAAGEPVDADGCSASQRAQKTVVLPLTPAASLKSAVTWPSSTSRLSASRVRCSGQAGAAQIPMKHRR